MNQEKWRSEGIGARVIPASRDHYLVRNSERGSMVSTQMRYSFGSSTPKIAADKMRIACVGANVRVVRARTRTGAPIWNRWPGMGCGWRGFAEGAVGDGEASTGTTTSRLTGVEIGAAAIA